MRKKVAGVFLFIFLSSWAQAAQETPPLTLSEAFRLALKRSEDIAIKQEVIHEAEGRFYQALSGILPKVRFVSTHFWQDAPKPGGGGAEGVSGDFIRRTKPERKFVFSQPLFTGFRELAAIQGASSEKNQRLYERKRAEELLFVDVTEAFYNLLQARKRAEILRRTRRLMRERLGELKKRVNLGRSRESEMQTTLSDLRVVEADWEDARREETLFRRLLEFYVGRRIREELQNGNEFQGKNLPLSRYLVKRKDRFDVRAAGEAYRLAIKRVVAAQSGLFPSAKVEGNYYAERVGFQSGVDWDVLLTLDVPLFQGTRVFGEIKEASALRDAEELRWQKAIREAELEIKDAYEKLRSSKRKKETLLGALAASKKNYELQTEEYRLNLVNNLDVLDALRRYQEIYERFNEAYFEAKKDYWRLKIAAGEA